MFDPADTCRVFGLPPGADFPAELAAGVLARMAGKPPEALARVTILVNTRRMQRRLKALFSDGAPKLLPRILLVTDLNEMVPGADIPPAITPLRRRLELSQLVARLISEEPDLAPLSASVDLADSLAALMDEMQGEGVSPETLQQLDTGDLSGHWDRSLRFLSIAAEYDAVLGQRGLDQEARRRLAAELLVGSWSANAPGDPIIIAGSTGSRSTTSLLMQAVTRLPQGAVIMPGFDFEMPGDTWASLLDRKLSPLGSEDHPQYRFADFLTTIEAVPSGVRNWTGITERQERNALISLSLRPAPITHQWLAEGPTLGDLIPRTQGLSLMEAAQPRDEAHGIAAALREALEDGKTAALVTTDRTLGRVVAAALLRWGIVADDSAGRPLSLTAPGRFLRQVGGIIGRSVEPLDLVALLKHPLTRSTESDRGAHLRLTRELELYFRAERVVLISSETIIAFGEKRSEEEKAWCAWLSAWLADAMVLPAPNLGSCLAAHVAASESLASGDGEGSGQLWERAAGRDVLAIIDAFRAEADFPGTLPFTEYVRLLERALSAANTRIHDGVRPDVMIWGTLEARVQGADLVVLGGLNEGTWPERPTADPWLNRNLRRQAGLLLPERQIGLSAHDYQQAIGAREVILSRAKRDSESQTVPSRWLSRLTNLLEGLKDQRGPEALEAMQKRGQRYLAMSEAIDAPRLKIKPEARPAPAPPGSTRPKSYSITDIQRLIRDPYSIYAKHILRLSKLETLPVEPDARLRGNIFHEIVREAFGRESNFLDVEAEVKLLLDIAERHLALLPWFATRIHWMGHLNLIAESIVLEEQLRRKGGQPVALEIKGRMEIPGTAIAIKGKADRIDRLTDGLLVVYDYKTGTPPTPKQIRHFDLQLPIEAVMTEHGAFEGLPAGKVDHVAHIGLGRTPKTVETRLELNDDVDLRTEAILELLGGLLRAFDESGKGYSSRRAMELQRFDGDYDHLARFGEWDETMLPVTVYLQ